MFIAALIAMVLMLILQPEWYFTQLSSWIRDHTHFLEQKVQPLLDIADLSHINALVSQSYHVTIM